MGEEMTQSDTILSDSSSKNDKDIQIQIVKDIFDIIVEKGPISIYKLTKELHTNNKYKNVNWNALRMKITRIIYRLILAGMLQYKKGPRNSKLIDISYNYLYGKYGEIPKDILKRHSIDIEKIKKNPVEEIRKLLMNKKKSITESFLSRIVKHEKLSGLYLAFIKSDIKSVLIEVLGLLEPDLFRGWDALAAKVKDYYYDALLRREIKRNPGLEAAYFLIKLNESDDDNFFEYELSVYDAFIEKICSKYGTNSECPENFPNIVDMISNGHEDYIEYKNPKDLLISKVVLPKILNTINFPWFVDNAKAISILTGKVIDPIDFKEAVKESILISNDPRYIEALRETIREIFPYIVRRTKLIETELNAYKGLEEALRELLEETRSKSKD